MSQCEFGDSIRAVETSQGIDSFHEHHLSLPTLVPPIQKGIISLGKSWEFHSLNGGLFNNNYAKQIPAPILLSKIS